MGDTPGTSTLLAKLRSVQDRGCGLLCRLYLIRLQLAPESDERPSALTAPEYQKVRVRLERSFPTEAIDFSKFPGSESFVNRAADVRQGLVDVAHAAQDVHEFAVEAQTLLLTSANGLHGFRVEETRLLLHAYFDLLCCYMRVLMLFNSVPDRGLAFAMYCTAVLLSTGAPVPAFLDVHATIANTDKLMQYFFKTFQRTTANLGALLMLLADAVAACDDCRQLYQDRVFDIGGDLDVFRDADSLPPRPPTGRRRSTGGSSGSSSNNDSGCNVSPQAEVMVAAVKYREYVVFAFLLCPEMLLDPTLFELFRRVGSRALVVQVFRNVTLSFHPEFETIGAQYLSWKVLGKEKSQKALRHVAKTAVLTAGLVMRQRRAFILAELEAINSLLRIEPGLVAPKLPQILAALAFAHAELMAYFCHTDVAKDNVRRDTRKHLHPHRYLGTDVAALLSHVCALLARVRAQEDSGHVRRYYAEQLVANDLRALQVRNAIPYHALPYHAMPLEWDGHTHTCRLQLKLRRR